MIPETPTVGDTCVLNTGGPVMTVTAIKTAVEVAWIDDSNQLQCAVLSVGNLRDSTAQELLDSALKRYGLNQRPKRITSPMSTDTQPRSVTELCKAHPNLAEFIAAKDKIIAEWDEDYHILLGRMGKPPCPACKGTATSLSPRPNPVSPAPNAIAPASPYERQGYHQGRVRSPLSEDAWLGRLYGRFPTSPAAKSSSNGTKAAFHAMIEVTDGEE